MDSFTADQRARMALQKTKDLRQSARRSRFSDRPREKKSLYTPYFVKSAAVVDRVRLHKEQSEADFYREAFAASRDRLYKRLVAQFGGDDCGCDE